MVTSRSYMFEFSVNKDMKIRIYGNKEGGSREDSGPFMSNTNCQELEISVEQGRW